MNTYTYDAANRLRAFDAPSLTSAFAYNGLGGRVRQTVDGINTNYTLDLNAGLTQVLDDGTSTYLYGLGRLAQSSVSDEYFLGDALSSVRQLADESDTVTPAGATRLPACLQPRGLPS
jgi:YD repeat-containing protein